MLLSHESWGYSQQGREGKGGKVSTVHVPGSREKGALYYC